MAESRRPLEHEGSTRQRLPRAAVALGFIALASLVHPPGYTAGQQPPTVRLGGPGVSVKAEFTEVTSVRELADGRLLVADRRERRLVLIDWSTGHAASVGRIGDGPGEFRNILQLHALGNDSTLLIDDSRRRWLVLHGPHIVATLAAPVFLNEQIGLALYGADRNGHLLGVQGFFWKTPPPVRERYSADSLLVLRAHRSSAVIDTIARVRGRGEPNTSYARRPGAVPAVAPNPLPLEDQALLFPDGWIAIVTVDPYRVNWRSPEGRHIEGQPLPFARIRLNDTEKCAALKRVSRNPSRFECRPQIVRNWPGAVPPFLPDALLPMPDGRLAIRRTGTVGSLDTTYDIVDRSGRLTMRITLPADERIVAFGTRWVYTVAMDDNDIQQLRRYPSL